MKAVKKTLHLLIIAILIASFALALTACNKEDPPTPRVPVYTVTFVSNGGSEVTTQYVEEGGTATRPDAPTRNGFEFIDWYPDSSCTGTPFNFNTVLTGDVAVYAKWQATQEETPVDPPETEYVTLTLVYNYENKTENRQVEKGSTATLETPVRNGYTFGGWFTDESLSLRFDDSAPLNSDATVYAKWSQDSTPVDPPETEYVTLTLVYNYENKTENRQVEKGSTATLETPVRSGYTFGGWFTDESLNLRFDESAPLNSDATVYAKWSQDSTPVDPPVTEYVTLTLVYNYENKTENRQVEKGSTATLETPVRSGYTFGGWFTDAVLTELFNLNTPLTLDATLYAKWTKDEDPVTPVTKYTVSFESNGGSAITAVQVNQGETLGTLPTPSRSGYKFAGWYSDSSLTLAFSADSPINANLTLYAKWSLETSGGTTTETYTVTFHSMGGSSVPSQTVAAGGTAAKPASPSAEGKQFVNWYSDSACTKIYDFSAPVQANITLYAGWTTLDSKILSTGGYFESLYVTWTETLPSAATVYYREASSSGSWTEVESGLIRAIEPNVARVDIVGLKAGSYNVKIQPSSGTGIELPAPVTVEAYDRSGYAHFNYTEGVGAYNDDGTIKNSKNGTLVIYLTDENKNDISDSAYVNGVKTDISRYFWNGQKGIGYLLNNRQYNSDAERATYGIQALSFYFDAVVIRVIGTVNAETSDPAVSLIDGLTAYDSTDNGGSTGDNGRMARITNAKNLTFEGIGEDACIYGWGIHFISNDNLHRYEGSGKSFEVRNLTFEHYPEDAIGMEGTQGYANAAGSITSGESSASSPLCSPVERCWIHNNVFLPGYCSAPAESDKAEGDGSCDFKRGQYYTLSYNYFEYCHKTNLIGSADTSLTYNVTMHHNWWNNCGSRMPLARRANIHFYNNYITGDSTDVNAALSYVTSLRANCLVFSEANYYDGSKNVTQIKDGTGVSLGNVYYACTGENAYIELTSRTQTVDNNCAFIYYGIDYSQFYIDPDLFYYDAVNQVSDCLLDDAVTARVKVMMYAGVNGFGKTAPAMTQYAPDSAVTVGSDGLTVDLTTVAKGTSTVSGVLFTNITGSSGGVVKGKGQIITFTLTSEAELTVTATASSADYYGELISSDGTVWANKFTNLTIVLPAGTYAIASGDRAKELSVSSLSFADTAASSAARIQAVNDAIDALPATITMQNGSAVKAAQQAFTALTASEKLTYESENAARYTKLNDAVAQYERLLVADVVAKIDAIGTVTATSYDKINDAQIAYDSLDSALKIRVTNYSTLTAAWTSYNAFAVSNMNSQIAALTDVSGLSVTDQNAISEAQTAYEAAKTAYEKLDEDQQAQVSDYGKVTDGLAVLEQLNRLFEFQAQLAECGTDDVTLGEGATLKILYDSLTAAQKAALTSAEQSKYSAIMEKYEALASQTQTCSFDGAVSNAAWTVSGNYYTSTLTINATGDTFAKGLKIETATSISFTTGTQMELTLYFHSTNAGKVVKVDDTDYTIETSANGDCYVTVTLDAGAHTIAKAKNITNTYLYLAVLTPVA